MLWVKPKMTQVTRFLTALLFAALAGTAAAQPSAPAEGDLVLGQEDAPVTVIEYASYTCPHCGTFHRNTLPHVKETYVKTGKVKYVYREYLRNRLDLAAALLARCGGEESFAGMVDMLFRTQDNWLVAEDKMAALRQIARFNGIGEDQFNTCLQNETLTNAMVANTQEAVQKHNLEATPSFVVNGETYSGALTPEQFDEIMADHLPQDE